MKAIIITIAAATMLFACNPAEDKAGNGKSAGNHAPENFDDSLAALNKTEMGNLTVAVNHFEESIDNDKEGDAALPQLLQYITASLDTLNDGLAKSSSEYIALVNDSIKNPTPKQLALVKNMTGHHTQLQNDGEGGIYLEYDYAWLLKEIGGDLSEPVREYLGVTAAEVSMPLSSDGAIVLPLQTLADRILTTEKLQTQQLPTTFSSDIKKVNTYYTNALLFGADNTPSLLRGTSKIAPLFDQAYNYVVSKSPQSAIAAKIGEWRKVIATGAKGEIDKFMKANWAME
ncbi:MAG: hypothetical protein V4676_13090 [Bacteroidota bacterium]